jgi:hypothetical protein
MKFIILAVTFLSSQNAYKYKVRNIETNQEGYVFSLNYYNEKDTICILK